MKKIRLILVLMFTFVFFNESFSQRKKFGKNSLKDSIFIEFPNSYKKENQNGIKISFLDAKNLYTTKSALSRKRFQIVLIKIKRKVSVEECIAFIKAQKGIYLSAEDLIYVINNNKDILPKKNIIAFNKKDLLEHPMKNNKSFFKVPYVNKHYDFHFLGSNTKINSDFVLIYLKP